MSSKNVGTAGRALLAVAVAILPSLAVSDEVKAPGKPVVISATVDFGQGQITIAGETFPSTPTVTLDGTPLNVTSASPTQIVASLQPVAGIQSLPGDYQLKVCDSHGCATFVVTIGVGQAAGPCFDNANRYVDCGNGTVTDTVTGLIWLRDANCFGLSSYATANQAAAGLAAGQCGLTDGSSAGDWRLPTKAEWEGTIAEAVALSCSNPSLTNDPGTGCLSAGPTSFTGVQSNWYWSSSANQGLPVFAWVVDLSNGTVFNEGKVVNSLVVWPVRGGQ